MTAFPSNRSCPRCKGEMQYICLTSIPPQYKARCLYCGYEEGENIKQPKTRADKIRTTTDEELAAWFERFASCELCPASRERCGYGNGCIEAWLDWLKKEVEK